MLVDSIILLWCSSAVWIQLSTLLDSKVEDFSFEDSQYYSCSRAKLMDQVTILNFSHSKDMSSDIKANHTFHHQVCKDVKRQGCAVQ